MLYRFGKYRGKLVLVFAGCVFLLTFWLMLSTQKQYALQSEATVPASTTIECAPDIFPVPTPLPIQANLSEAGCYYLPLVIHDQRDLTPTAVPTINVSPAPTPAP